MAIDLDEAKVRRNELGLWLSWALATGAGMALGYLPAALLVNVLDLGLARVIVPLLVGFLVGFAQWLVLRRYMTDSQDWILAGGAGWAVGYALGLAIIQLLANSPFGTWLGYILFGILIGLVQWPVLRREIPRASTWVLASVVGWTVGAAVSYLFLNAIFPGNQASQASFPLVAVVDSGLTGLVAGAITGLALVWLVRQPDRVRQSI
jgi:hypothetical protein